MDKDKFFDEVELLIEDNEYDDLSDWFFELERELDE